MTLRRRRQLTPSIRWREHLAGGKITGIDTVIVGQPEFFQQVEKSLRAHAIDDWKTYLRWQLATLTRSEAGRPLRRGELPLLRHDPERHARAAPALEAHARRGGRLPWRCARPAVRHAVLLAARRSSATRS